MCTLELFGHTHHHTSTANFCCNIDSAIVIPLHAPAGHWHVQISDWSNWHHVGEFRRRLWACLVQLQLLYITSGVESGVELWSCLNPAPQL